MGVGRELKQEDVCASLILGAGHNKLSKLKHGLTTLSHGSKEEPKKGNQKIGTKKSELSTLHGVV